MTNPRQPPVGDPPDGPTAPASSTALALAGVGGSVPAVAETSSTAVAAREKAAVEARFLMALHRPRNPDQARLNILSACKRPRFAESVQYAKPVGRNKVTGLSIRFAEEALRAWGNLDVQALVVFDDRERRIYRVSATDLETNATQQQDVIVEKFVERRNIRQGDEVIGSRKNTHGDTVYLKVATEDEILVKSNAALSKARRNVILMLIPSDIREEAEEQALETVRDRDAKDPAGARKSLLDAFYATGVMPDQVTGLIGKPLDQINPAELHLLRTVYTALKQSETTWAEVETDEGLARFRKANGGEQKTKRTKKKGTAGLKDATKPKGKKDDEEPPATAKDPPPPDEPTTEEIRRQEQDELRMEGQ